MCGYIRREGQGSAIRDLLGRIGLGSLQQHFPSEDQVDIEHFYPAFGGDPGKQIHNLIISGEKGPEVVDATWWFDCQPVGDSLRIGQRTTFNARNLDSPYWKGALRHHRGLAIATGLGESKRVGGRKHQYYMEGAAPFLLGALYRSFDNGLYSCAVITRDSHPRFDEYHDKAFPCFIPAESRFVDLWLNDVGAVPPEVTAYLNQPRITEDLWISEVQTFKRASRDLTAVHLPADDAP